MIYFQEQRKSKNTYDQISVYPSGDSEDRVIKIGDIVDIVVTSDNEAAEKKYNLKKALQGEYMTGDLIPAGYLVGEDGKIIVSGLGKIQATGYTIKQLKENLLDTLRPYLNNFQVDVAMSGFRVFVVGEVNQPGMKYINGNNATILDALSLASDISADASTERLKIIRNSNSNKKEVIFVDLNDIDIFRSKAYHLQSNDIIYVPKRKQVTLLNNLSVISIFATLTNTFVLVFTLTR
jgi:polysaccharide export outer membrane protein